MKTHYEVVQEFWTTRKNTQRMTTTSLARAVNSVIVRSRKTPDSYIELSTPHGRFLASYNARDGYHWQWELESDSWQRRIQDRLSQ